MSSLNSILSSFCSSESYSSSKEHQSDESNFKIEDALTHSDNGLKDGSTQFSSIISGSIASSKNQQSTISHSGILSDNSDFQSKKSSSYIKNRSLHNSSNEQPISTSSFLRKVGELSDESRENEPSDQINESSILDDDISAVLKTDHYEESSFSSSINEILSQSNISKTRSGHGEKTNGIEHEKTCSENSNSEVVDEFISQSLKNTGEVNIAPSPKLSPTEISESDSDIISSSLKGTTSISANSRKSTSSSSLILEDSSDILSSLRRTDELTLSINKKLDPDLPLTSTTDTNNSHRSIISDSLSDKSSYHSNGSSRKPKHNSIFSGSSSSGHNSRNSDSKKNESKHTKEDEFPSSILSGSEDFLDKNKKNQPKQNSKSSECERLRLSDGNGIKLDSISNKDNGFSSILSSTFGNSTKERSSLKSSKSDKSSSSTSSRHSNDKMPKDFKHNEDSILSDSDFLDSSLTNEHKTSENSKITTFLSNDSDDQNLKMANQKKPRRRSAVHDSTDILSTADLGLGSSNEILSSTFSSSGRSPRRTHRKKEERPKSASQLSIFDSKPSETPVEAVYNFSTARQQIRTDINDLISSSSLEQEKNNSSQSLSDIHSSALDNKTGNSDTEILTGSLPRQSVPMSKSTNLKEVQAEQKQQEKKRRKLAAEILSDFETESSGSLQSTHSIHSVSELILSSDSDTSVSLGLGLAQAKKMNRSRDVFTPVTSSNDVIAYDPSESIKIEDDIDIGRRTPIPSKLSSQSKFVEQDLVENESDFVVEDMSNGEIASSSEFDDKSAAPETVQDSASAKTTSTINDDIINSSTSTIQVIDEGEGNSDSSFLIEDLSASKSKTATKKEKSDTTEDFISESITTNKTVEDEDDFISEYSPSKSAIEDDFISEIPSKPNANSDFSSDKVQSSVDIIDIQEESINESFQTSSTTVTSMESVESCQNSDVRSSEGTENEKLAQKFSPEVSDEFEEQISPKKYTKPYVSKQPKFTFQNPYRVTVAGSKVPKGEMHSIHHTQLSIRPASDASPRLFRSPHQMRSKRAKEILFDSRILGSTTTREVNAAYRESILENEQRLALLQQSFDSYRITRKMRDEQRSPNRGINLKDVNLEIEERIKRRAEEKKRLEGHFI